MKYEPVLEKAILVRRYKRFLADVRLDTGELFTIHCPNTGAMTNCAEPGFEVLYSTSSNTKRKYPCTWELALNSFGNTIGINAIKANQIVKEAIEENNIEELLAYDSLRREVKYGENSRIDFLLSAQGKPDCYVEVKSVTLLDTDFGGAMGFFPDAVSERGRKHLRELVQMLKNGHRAVLLFCVQHSGIESVQAATHVDPAYAQALKEAVAQGLEILAYKCSMSAHENRISSAVPFIHDTEGKFALKGGFE